jgi:hypothetical protein
MAQARASAETMQRLPQADREAWADHALRVFCELDVVCAISQDQRIRDDAERNLKLWHSYDTLSARHRYALDRQGMLFDSAGRVQYGLWSGSKFPDLKQGLGIWLPEEVVTDVNLVINPLLEPELGDSPYEKIRSHDLSVKDAVTETSAAVYLARAEKLSDFLATLVIEN